MIPPAGGKPGHPDGQPRGSRPVRPAYLKPSNVRRPQGSGRHFNPYWHSGWRRRAPSFLLSPHLYRPVKKRSLLLPVMAGLVAFMFMAALAITVAAIVTPVTIGAAVYTERYNSLGLDKEYSLTFETTRIYDRKGVLLYEKQPEEGLREYVTFDKIPKVLIDATTAAEDPTFFDNRGVDPYALVRAAYINLSKRGSSGASTITQQVARILYLPPQQRNEISPDRKVDEIILAIKITDTMPKEKILEKYFNNIYYGNLAYGIQAASLGYFGKEAKDLDLAEASMLAGLPQAPSLYDPTLDYELARRRQKIVLDLMVKYDRISQPEADAAYRVDLKERLIDRRTQKAFIQAPHFVNYVLQQLSGEIESPQRAALAAAGLTKEELSQGGYEIYTTIDLDLVNRAQEVVAANVEELKKRKASNAALVALRPNTGEILSMVGSTNYNNATNQGQFNAAIARRQPGSALKPLTYAFAMKKGWTAATVLADVRTEFPSGGTTPYVPQNFDGSLRGPVPLRYALGSSLNIPAVKALQFDGLETFIREAKDMGISFQHGPERYGLTLTLGGGEVRLIDLVGAYSVFDNLGDKVDTVSILKVTKRGHGEADEVVYQFEPDKVKRKNVMSPQIAYIITNILSDNEARLLSFARNNPLVLDRPAAAKTGTSNDFVDSWTIGYTPDVVVGVWVGNNNNTQMDGVAGSVGAGLIWNNYMNAVYKEPKLTEALKQGGQLQQDFVRPNDIEEVTICVESGLLPNDACPQRRKELFPKADVPKKVSDIHRIIKVPRGRSPAPSPDTAIRDFFNSTPAPTVTPSSLFCIPDSSWPDGLLESRLFYVYPPELQQWAARQGRQAPPTQPCGTYVPPTPTPTRTPTPQPSPSATPSAATSPDPNNPTVRPPGNPAPQPPGNQPINPPPGNPAPRPTTEPPFSDGSTPAPARPAITRPPTPRSTVAPPTKAPAPTPTKK